MAEFRLVRTVLVALPALRGKGVAALLVAGIVGGLVACTPIIRNHGYVPAEDELALVEVAVDTRETVNQKIGRPSTSGLSRYYQASSPGYSFSFRVAQAFGG